MSKRILVVEDHADNRQIIRDMLYYEITEAENGEGALAAIAKQRPDLILMDISNCRLWTVTPPRGRSKPIPRCERSRLSQSPPMRSTEKSGLRASVSVMLPFGYCSP
jgi:DNA-binding NarL/FixJ family response regulator